MKDQLVKIITESKSNKHKHNVSKHPEVYEWVMQQTDTLPDTASFLERIYCAISGEHPTCPLGNQKKFTQNLKAGYMFCGRETKCECARKNKSSKISEAKQSMTPEEVAASNEKRQKTNETLYGVAFNSQRQDVKDAKRTTCLEKFGTITNLLDDETISKSKKTMAERYGSETYNNRDKARQTLVSRYGVNPNKKFHYTKEALVLFSDPVLFQHELDAIGVGGIKDKYGIVSGSTIYNYIRDNNITYEYRQSAPEYMIDEILKDLDVVYATNTRTVIPPYELDFYSPDHKIAIEVNGLYWHSEINQPNMNYHLIKTLLCQKQGIQLFSIFEDEIYDRCDIVKRRLRHALGKSSIRIHARQCTISEVSVNDARVFCDTYHIQGYAAAGIKIGAYHNDELVALMTFGKPRSNAKYEYELLRFCLGEYHIPGIANRLFTWFTREYTPSSVVSYSDSRWSNGNVYRKIGFELSHYSPPNYWYTKDFKKRHHRFKFRKGKLMERGDYDPDMTEREIMDLRGYVRIWDCGNGVWVWEAY